MVALVYLEFELAKNMRPRPFGARLATPLVNRNDNGRLHRKFGEQLSAFNRPVIVLRTLPCARLVL